MLNRNDVMSPEEAWTELGVSRQWLHKLVISGRAPAHIRVGDALIFDRADVERHAEARRRKVKRKNHD